MKTMKEILEYHNVHGFDKAGGTDKGTDHSYLETYEDILSPYVDKEINLLEVGVQFGGSALLWHEYFPKSNLFLIDVYNQVPDFIFEKMSKERFKFYIMNAYGDQETDLLNKDCPEGFDIVLDDGPHTLESQVMFIHKYLPLVKKGGILIIEDIQDVLHFEILKNSTPEEYRNSIETFDLRNVKNRYDDLIFVIRK